MYSHTTLGTNDMAKAERFYDAIMEVLGHKALFKLPELLAYGELTGEKLFILPPFNGDQARSGNGVHVAFKTDSRARGAQPSASEPGEWLRAALPRGEGGQRPLFEWE